jgi:hypothetical protein
MTRARRAASARPRPDRTRASRSDRWSVVSTSKVDGMRHHMIYNSSVQATRAFGYGEIYRRPRLSGDQWLRSRGLRGPRDRLGGGGRPDRPPQNDLEGSGARSGGRAEGTAREGLRLPSERGDVGARLSERTAHDTGGVAKRTAGKSLHVRRLHPDVSDATCREGGRKRGC